MVTGSIDRDGMLGDMPGLRGEASLILHFALCTAHARGFGRRELEKHAGSVLFSNEREETKMKISSAEKRMSSPQA